MNNKGFDKGIKRDFSRSPLLSFWEVTRACDLVCVHCRAEAQPDRDPRELTTQEGIELIDSISRFGDPLPILVFTGGDPLKRDDLYELIRYAKGKGFHVGLSPSGTPLLNSEAIRRLKDGGVGLMSISLDGSNPERHDSFRQVEGSYQWTINALKECQDIHFPIQINTTVTRKTVDDLEAISRRVAEFGAMRWSLFFLVPTGRARKEDQITPERYEEVLMWLYDLSCTNPPFQINTTAAPHFRRVTIEGRKKRKREGNESSMKGDTVLNVEVTCGSGFVFVSHIGEVYPCGFFPLKAGDVRKESIVNIYRDSTLFNDLRDRNKLKGKCSKCEYKWICSGCSARAYLETGNYLNEEPYCTYIPLKISEAYASG
ncbi:MAG: TIGR04053 family radical SAM/SPASM domain-containing protein [Nitrospinae bacterium]|nr:TIGR04053 family radical SAM/SPASM domain-containing protein [Nitrospinota bacterium]